MGVLWDDPLALWDDPLVEWDALVAPTPAPTPSAPTTGGVARPRRIVVPDAIPSRSAVARGRFAQIEVYPPGGAAQGVAVAEGPLAAASTFSIPARATGAATAEAQLAAASVTSTSALAGGAAVAIGELNLQVRAHPFSDREAIEVAAALIELLETS